MSAAKICHANTPLTMISTTIPDSPKIAAIKPRPAGAIGIAPATNVQHADRREHERAELRGALRRAGSRPS